MNIKSPCVSKCLLKNNICIGCKRTMEEIGKWITYSDKQKLKIINRIKSYNTLNDQ